MGLNTNSTHKETELSLDPKHSKYSSLDWLEPFSISAKLDDPYWRDEKGNLKRGLIFNHFKKELQAYINKEKAKAELAGRKEQVMQDFMSAVVDFDIDESLIIAWRDRQLAELQAQLTKGKEKEL